MKQDQIISIIAAIGKNHELGKEGNLIWKIPEDMKYFKEVTKNKPVVMGRKTWESIPIKFRPLSDRKNIIITTQKNYKADGAIIVDSIDKAIKICSNDPEIFIIGGSQIYDQTIELANKLYITHIDMEAEADSFFPSIDLTSWKIRSNIPIMSKNLIKLDFLIYDRSN